MNKDDSLALKGVAILMMLLLHLFFSIKHSEFTYFLSVGGESFLGHFSGLCNPVPLFLMISGYGLYSSYAQRGNIKVGKRILNLYLHLWIIYLIFVPIGSYVKPADYPGGLLCFIENATSWHVTYNGEQWFLFPYIIILLTSGLIFKVADKTKPALLLGVTMLIYVTYCVSIKKWGGVWNYIGHGGYWVFSAFGFLFPFTIGICLKKYQWCEKYSNLITKISPYYKWISLDLLLALILVRWFLNNYSFQVFAVAIIFLLFPTFPIGEKFKAVLKYLGKHSMNIWLIHTYFCYYLFRDFIYGLKYPILIFSATLILSLLSSIIVEFLYGLLKQGLLKININIEK